jgi:hypothetical protein
MMLKIYVQLKETAQPITHDALNSYTKGPFYCVYVAGDKVYKYPLVDLWRVTEDYGEHP